MKIKQVVKSMVDKYWFESSFVKRRVENYQEAMRKKYNYEVKPTIISSNCIGGIIYHNLNQQFLSPTINLFIPGKDFIKFISNLESYLNEELVFIGYGKGGYPIGELKDISIHFNHYDNFEEAKLKWEERSKRIDYNNLYIMLHERGLDYKDIAQLREVNCKRLTLFTSKDYPEFDYTFKLSRYEKKGKVGDYVIKDIDGFREFEKSFDYVNWLNGEKELKIDKAKK